jgi:transposase
MQKPEEQKPRRKQVFKTYQPTQALLLPPSFDELIVKTHPVRVVAEVIDKIDLKPLLEKYEGGGTSCHHPRMMLKILVYAYVSNIYSSRKIAAALKENIHFMWLAAMNAPDHNSINRFRSQRLSVVLQKIFSQVVQLLAQEGHLSIKEVFTDGTKIEANANRYTFVWARTIQYNRERIKQQLKELWNYSIKVAAEEMSDDTPPDFNHIDSEKVKQTIEKINEALKDKPVSKEVKQKLKYAEKNWADKIDEYEQQEQILDGRNSYSKTDTDATFMRLKEDHMKNGQLKPAYNLLVSTSNQYIVTYSIHPNPTDTSTLPAHMEAYKELYEETPQVLVADAGYGSEQNLACLEQNNVEAFVKHNYFDKDQKKSRTDKKPFTPGKLHYNKEGDYYVCPMGQHMHRTSEHVQQTDNGYSRTISTYRAGNCEGCTLRGMCHRAEGNRTIQVSHEGNRLKQQATERLLTDRGVAYRKKRCWDVEPVFANLKQNKGFRRFMLRGKEKVGIEAGLLAIAHNLQKKVA